MRMRHTIAALLLLAFTAPLGGLHAAEAEFNRLMTATTLRCIVGPGATGNWESNQPTIEVGNWGKNNTLHFDQINLTEGKARLIGNAGSETIRLVSTKKGLHFFEFTATGNLIVTTVFGETVEQEYPLVVSRHINLGHGVGGPLPSQWLGSCERME